MTTLDTTVQPLGGHIANNSRFDRANVRRLGVLLSEASFHCVVAGLGSMAFDVGARLMLLMTNSLPQQRLRTLFTIYTRQQIRQEDYVSEYGVARDLLAHHTLETPIGRPWVK